jgi:hypothetical protein
LNARETAVCSLLPVLPMATRAIVHFFNPEIRFRDSIMDEISACIPENAITQHEFMQHDLFTYGISIILCRQY